MMTKTQKIWLWISGAMFLIPEILFFTTYSSIISILNNFSGMTIKAPIYFLINQQFFVDHSFFALLAMAIEWIGVLGLLVLSAKINKKIIAVLSGIVLLWLSVLIFLGYVFSTMNPVL